MGPKCVRVHLGLCALVARTLWALRIASPFGTALKHILLFQIFQILICAGVCNIGHSNSLIQVVLSYAEMPFKAD